MVISQPPRNNPSYYYRASPTHLNCSECFRTPYVLYMQLQHQVTHRNGAIKHIFYTNQIHGGSSADYSLFILSLHALALHLRLNITSNLSVEDLSTLTLHTSVSCISLQNANRTALCYAAILLSENIPNIWHKSSTKHRRSDQIETIKTIMQTTPSYHMEGFTMARLPFLKKYSIKWKDLDCELFYSELKRQSHIIFTI